MNKQKPNNLYIIISPQEYVKANHKYLWHSMAKLKVKDTFLILNIPADYIISRIKKKKDRIFDAKQGVKKIDSNLFLLRPLYFLRPEVSPRFLYRHVCCKTFDIISSFFNIKEFKNIFILSYNGFWINVFKKCNKPNLFFFYYLLDEVRLDADTNRINPKRASFDSFACKESNIVFAMSRALANDRSNVAKKVVVSGNGANIYPLSNSKNVTKFEKSCAFIGNFRSWIDKELLSSIIDNCPDVSFYIIGNVEKNMNEFLQYLLSKNNVQYLGVFSKEEAVDVYRRFDSIIIPYIQNDFMYKTRPIKIVESVFCGTPVISIPVSGYEENDFIKFAKTKDEFSYWISFFIANKPSIETEQYKKFLKDNSWDSIAELLIENIEGCL